MELDVLWLLCFAALPAVVSAASYMHRLHARQDAPSSAYQMQLRVDSVNVQINRFDTLTGMVDFSAGNNVQTYTAERVPVFFNGTDTARWKFGGILFRTFCGTFNSRTDFNPLTPQGLPVIAYVAISSNCSLENGLMRTLGSANKTTLRGVIFGVQTDGRADLISRILSDAPAYRSFLETSEYLKNNLTDRTVYFPTMAVMDIAVGTEMTNLGSLFSSGNQDYWQKGFKNGDILQTLQVSFTELPRSVTLSGFIIAGIIAGGIAIVGVGVIVFCTRRRRPRKRRTNGASDASHRPLDMDTITYHSQYTTQNTKSRTDAEQSMNSYALEPIRPERAARVLGTSYTPRSDVVSASDATLFMMTGSHPNGSGPSGSLVLHPMPTTSTAIPAVPPPPIVTTSQPASQASTSVRPNTWTVPAPLLTDLQINSMMNTPGGFMRAPTSPQLFVGGGFGEQQVQFPEQGRTNVPSRPPDTWSNPGGSRNVQSSSRVSSGPSSGINAGASSGVSGLSMGSGAGGGDVSVEEGVEAKKGVQKKDDDLDPPEQHDSWTMPTPLW
ncbi:hypothetical protein BJ742DRAFT_382718 [Cladochytrium replicatum]|nr:hypothetical protein BJ742DRAFT_382718 [Cladochytrium replicatum]